MGAESAVIQLATRCETEDEFIERFARFATATDVVVPAVPNVDAGASGRFVIRLKDQSTVMAGHCEVSEVLPMAAPPGAPGRSLMRLRLMDMDARSRGVHLRLLERRAAIAKPPASPPAPRPTTIPSLSIVRPPPVTSPVVTPPPVTAPVASAPAPGVTPPRTTAPVASAPAPGVTPPRTTAPVASAPAPGVTPPRMTAPVAGAPPAASMMNVSSIPRPQSVRPSVMPTLIGTTASYGVSAQSFSVVAAPPLADLETTEVAIPRPEKRVAGAALTLPANPLSDLDAADLASFVEFQLLETEGGDSAAVGVTGKVRIDPSASAVPAPSASDATPAPGPTSAAPARPALSAARREQRIERALEIARRGWPYASCLMLGLVLGLALRPGPKAAASVPRPAPAPAPAVAPAPAPEPLPEVEPAAVAPAPAPAPASRKMAASVPGGCTASVATTPKDATVLWGDIALGTGPISRASVPCGQSVVTIRHDRYEDVTKTMTAKPGQIAALTERMHRPPATVKVVSVPPHAQIKMNGRSIGAAPRQMNTLRFEKIRLAASLPGHQPWSKTLYLRQADTTIDVDLVPVAKPAAKRAAPAAAPAAPAAGAGRGPVTAPAPGAARVPVSSPPRAY